VVALSESQLTEFGQDVAFAKNLDFDTIDFDVSSAVLAEQDFVTNANGDSTSFATFEQAAWANCSDSSTLWLFASGVRKNDSTSGGFFSVQWLDNYAIVERIQCHSFITPLWSSSSLRRQGAV
jgi:hypothetical protein